MGLVSVCACVQMLIKPYLDLPLDGVMLPMVNTSGRAEAAAGGFTRWKGCGVDWFAGVSDWGSMAAGIRAFKAGRDKIRG